jgi:hypothetical protein
VSRIIAVLVAVIVTAAVLRSAGPAIVAVAHVAVPLILVLGLVCVLVRLAWWLTGRW